MVKAALFSWMSNIPLLLWMYFILLDVLLRISLHERDDKIKIMGDNISQIIKLRTEIYRSTFLRVKVLQTTLSIRNFNLYLIQIFSFLQRFFWEKKRREINLWVITLLFGLYIGLRLGSLLKISIYIWTMNHRTFIKQAICHLT